MKYQQLILPAYAKVNLFLNITGKRTDGYHNLQTWFQFIDLKDNLIFSLTNKPQNFNLRSNKDICHKKDNLIFKAFMAIKKFAKKNQGVFIYLKKRIPMAGGLGGGSSNAATTLVALNQLWNCNLNLKKLIEIGVKIGADVPIFLFQRAAWAEGLGEKLTSKPYIEQYALIIKPNFHISTATMFADFNLKRNCLPLEQSKILNIKKLDNVFFKIIRKKHPHIQNVFKKLPDKNKLRLTGSGSCFYFLNSNYDRLLQNKRKLEKSVDSWIVKTLNSAPIEELSRSDHIDLI